MYTTIRSSACGQGPAGASQPERPETTTTNHMPRLNITGDQLYSRPESLNPRSTLLNNG